MDTTKVEINEKLLAAWICAKAEESAANERRLDIEKHLIPCFQQLPEGTDTLRTERYKASATFKLTRALDGERLQSDWNQLPELAKDAFRWKPDLDMKFFRSLETANPAVFAVIQPYITTKAAKPSIKIEEI